MVLEPEVVDIGVGDERRAPPGHLLKVQGFVYNLRDFRQQVTVQSNTDDGGALLQERHGDVGVRPIVPDQPLGERLGVVRVGLNALLRHLRLGNSNRRWWLHLLGRSLFRPVDGFAPRPPTRGHLDNAGRLGLHRDVAIALAGGLPLHLHEATLHQAAIPRGALLRAAAPRSRRGRRRGRHVVNHRLRDRSDLVELAVVGRCPHHGPGRLQVAAGGSAGGTSTVVWRHCSGTFGFKLRLGVSRPPALAARVILGRLVQRTAPLPRLSGCGLVRQAQTVQRRHLVGAAGPLPTSRRLGTELRGVRRRPGSALRALRDDAAGESD
mmetsp:Transcript_30704/g.88641  ORF Transcript_30704/g.88641 Transcript_30704/m.88641 type:complete len:323 (-) Transcript_30704:403-1371(-)